MRLPRRLLQWGRGDRRVTIHVGRGQSTLARPAGEIGRETLGEAMRLTSALPGRPACVLVHRDPQDPAYRGGSA